MPKRKNKRFQKTNQARKNEQIRAPEVRLIGEDGGNLGIIKTEEALKKARDAGLDLIEISAKAKPPVARIIDWGKYTYQQEKKQKEAKKKQEVGNIIKGVRVGMQTSEHDLGIKAKEVDKFLKKGYKVRVELRMRGREKALREMADKKIEEFLNAIKEEHEIEQSLKRNPRGMQLTIKPR